MTTLATMRNRVSFGMGAKSNLSAQIDLALNEATLQHTLTVKPREMQKSTTFSSVDGTAAYNLDSSVATDGDLYAILYVRDQTNDLPLLQGDETSYHLENQDATVAGNKGRPNRWIHIEDDLVIYSLIPDAVLTI